LYMLTIKNTSYTLQDQKHHWILKLSPCSPKYLDYTNVKPYNITIIQLESKIKLIVQYATLESKQVQVLGCRNLPDFQKRWTSAELWRTLMTQQELKSLNFFKNNSLIFWKTKQLCFWKIVNTIMVLCEN